MGYTLLKNKAAYSIVKINENGSPIEFFVKSHNYESGMNGTGRTLLVRKDCWPIAMKFNDPDTTLLYADSGLDTWFNSSYKSVLDENIQTAIGTTQFKWKKREFISASEGYSETEYQIARSVFTLGVDDYIASSVLQIAYVGGTAVRYWTSSMVLGASGNKSNFTVSADGTKAVGDEKANYYARPCFTLPDTALVLDDGTIVVNDPPSISGSDSGLGTFSASGPSVSYTVTDANDDPVTVTIKLDGAVKKAHAVTLGQAYSFGFTASEWMKVLNGAHTLKIIADDGYEQTERTYTFTKTVTSMSFTLSEPLPADDMITKAIESIIGVIPANATTKIEVCNNGYDASPTWEDVTQKVLAGEKFQLTNAVKTAGSWGYNVRVSVSRGSATGDIYISSMGGFFE